MLWFVGCKLICSVVACASTHTHTHRHIHARIYKGYASLFFTASYPQRSLPLIPAGKHSIHACSIDPSPLAAILPHTVYACCMQQICKNIIGASACCWIFQYFKHTAIQKSSQAILQLSSATKYKHIYAYVAILKLLWQCVRTFVLVCANYHKNRLHKKSACKLESGVEQTQQTHTHTHTTVVERWNLYKWTACFLLDKYWFQYRYWSL